MAVELDDFQPAATLSGALAALAEHLQRITVQVRGDGRGAGSGVLWRPNGVIITNAHVARGSHATVELWDKRVFPAQVTSRDDGRDLAALSIEADDLPAATPGDSSVLRVGDLVLAVGHPLGLIGALTAGIIHAIVPGGARGQEEWVHADLRLAPGNSGGPLTNAAGHVIGINSMISGGLALAVPSAAVERFLGSVGQRPFLGVTTRPVALGSGAARSLGLLVLEVTPGSPAAAAGLLVGDVLTGANGQRFTRPDALGTALRAGTTRVPLRLDVMRGGTHTVIEALPDEVAPTQARAA